MSDLSQDIEQGVSDLTGGGGGDGNQQQGNSGMMDQGSSNQQSGAGGADSTADKYINKGRDILCLRFGDVG